MEHLHLYGFYSNMLTLDDYIEVSPGDIVKEYSIAWSLARVMVGVGQIDCQKVCGEKNKFWAVCFSYEIIDSKGASSLWLSFVISNI